MQAKAELVLFTKLFGGAAIAEIAKTASSLRFDGIDLLVRPGFALEPSQAHRLPTAVEQIRGEGLSVPLVTTDMIDADTYPAETVLRCCAEADVALVRMGYWPYARASGYAAILERARRSLDALVPLAQKYRVKLLLQLHGGTIHASGALASRLLEGYDTAHLGAYADPGNQVVQDGHEPWELTLDLLWHRLACLGVKNGGWFPGRYADSGQRTWTADWTPLHEGMARWDEIFAFLARSRFAGVLSFHSHYEVPRELAIAMTRVDLAYARRALGRDDGGD